MQSPPLDDRMLRALVRAVESPVTAPVILRLMYGDAGIAAMLAVPLEPGETAALDERPLGPDEVQP